MELALVNRVLVRSTGPKDAPVLVFIHAFADSGTAFLPLFNTPLVRGYRLVVPDLPGFGASPRQEGIETLVDYAAAALSVVRSLHPPGTVGLVAHSVASMISVYMAESLGERFGGLFSIEGNLTAEDAYFSGRAAEFDDAREFKRRFIDDLWTMGQGKPALRRYYASALAADPVAMWNLGRDARRLSVGDAPGQAYGAIRPSLYYWSAGNTTEASRRWIAQSGLDHRRFADASHWPMIDQPLATAAAIESFFSRQ